MVPVVADEHVRRRGLRGGGDERRVRVDHPHHRLPAGVGDPPLSHASVVVVDVREQPLDRVPVVRDLVGIGGAAGFRGRRADDLELALRPELSAHILEGEDVPGAVELPRRPERVPVLAGFVGADGIGRAEEEDGILARAVPRFVDERVEFDPVPHRDHVLRFLVVLEQEIEVRRGDGLGVSGGFGGGGRRGRRRRVRRVRLRPARNREQRDRPRHGPGPHRRRSSAQCVSAFPRRTFGSVIAVTEPFSVSPGA